MIDILSALSNEIVLTNLPNPDTINIKYGRDRLDLYEYKSGEFRKIIEAADLYITDLKIDIVRGVLKYKAFMECQIEYDARQTKDINLPVMSLEQVKNEFVRNTVVSFLTSRFGTDQTITEWKKAYTIKAIEIANDIWDNT